MRAQRPVDPRETATRCGGWGRGRGLGRRKSHHVRGFSFNQGRRRETWLCGKAAAWFGHILSRQVYNSRDTTEEQTQK